MVKDHLRTVVPVHGSRSLRTGTLRTILRDIELSPIEFAAGLEV
jgi:predicted RNA binding protein YcfA (HicA-like mRNA interferase family)